MKLIKMKSVKDDADFLSFLKKQSIADLKAIIDLAGLEMSMLEEYDKKTDDLWQGIADQAHREMLSRILSEKKA